MHKLIFLILTAVVAAQTVYANPTEKEGLNTPRFAFALIGDLPYDQRQLQTFPDFLHRLDAEKLAFVVHDGDFKNGRSLCDDATFYQRKTLFDASAHPFIFIPGDNEWTDCHRANNGAYDPLERLNKLRELFFAGDYSLGQRTLQLTRQSADPHYAKFRENVMWSYGDATFAGLNVPGSNNNLGRTPAMDAEYQERNAANLAWLKQVFSTAKHHNSLGVMIIIQADPGFELASTDPQRTGYNDFLKALEQETLAYGKPVVLVHGDSHYFRIDKPLLDSRTQQRIARFTRVETFGEADIGWLRVEVDPKDANLFVFKPYLLESVQ